MDKRICCDCKRERPIFMFNFSNRKKGTRKYFCKECAKVRRDKNKDEMKKYQKEWYSQNKEKKLEQSNKWKKENKEKRKETNKKYREKNREKENEYHRQYYRKNIEKCRGQARNKYHNNIERNRELARNRRRKKYEEDVNFKIKANVQRSINKAISGDFIYDKNFERLLGYKTKDLLKCLAGKFEDWMNWDNYGRQNKEKETWQIDHIIPQRMYDFCKDEEIKKCWDLRNLRPLNSKENNIKHGKVDWTLIEDMKLEDLLPEKILIEDMYNN